jgi:serralysin
MPATTTYATTGNAYIDGLLGDWKWAIKDFTFSFPTSASFYGAGYGNGEPLKGFAVLNAAQQAATRAALDQFSSVAKVTFTEITESATKHADLRLASSEAPSTAWAYFPSTAAEGGDAWFNKSSGDYSRPAKGNYAYVTFLHEIGHALGLEHAHEGNVMPVNRDSMEYTVMSYRSYVGASTTTGYTNETWGYAQSLMMYDIAALQHMYGADFTTHSENTTYRWSSASGEMFINGMGQGAPGGNKILLTVWDGGGSDTYDFSNYATALKVDLRPGEWTTTSAAQLAKLHYSGSKVAIGNIANALQFQGDTRSLIENAKGGTGSDTITGNAAANALWGNGGNDRLIGGDGNDNLVGGAGADRLDGGNGTDLASYANATAGIVADLYSAGSNTGDAAGDTYVSMERLYGSAFNDTLRGDNRANLLNGLAGNDMLNGRDGNDTLIGGNGADRLNGGGGTDTFVFETTAQSAPASRDVIDNFASGIDRMDLRSIDANSNAVGDQAFLFIGSSAFHGKAGELNFRSGIVSGDVNGDGLADFQVKVMNLSALSGSDFLL